MAITWKKLAFLEEVAWEEDVNGDLQPGTNGIGAGSGEDSVARSMATSAVSYASSADTSILNSGVPDAVARSMATSATTYAGSADTSVLGIVSVADSTYKIEILGCKLGALTFNMTPPASLAVDTKQADFSTVRAPSQANRLGSLNNNDKGTEIKSIAGTIIANLWSKEQRTLNSGESLSVSMSDVCLAILAAGTGAGTAATPGTSVLLRGLIIGGVLIGGGVVAYEAFREEGVASPSGFTSR